jgi:hypothetical protein
MEERKKRLEVEAEMTHGAKQEKVRHDHLGNCEFVNSVQTPPLLEVKDIVFGSI